ncbi:hypothetical protein [Neisseria sp. Ec49-e6-T10]|uniref:hypothetical protein n=1 Tax=Neisseria sp. Ec49-e6-T10 TaxID=3140744 RepID=UPI003EBBD694
MAFVNEYISEEDIQKYQLDDVMNEVKISRELITAEERQKRGLKYDWCIDRENNMWLKPCGMTYSPDPKYSRSGRPEPTGIYVFIFYYRGNYTKVSLERSSSSSKTIHESPFVIIWELISIQYLTKFNENKKYNEENVTKFIKYALQVYGRAGVDENIIKEIKIEFKI